MAEALRLQRPLQDDLLRIVASGEKEDPPAVDGCSFTPNVSVEEP